MSEKSSFGKKKLHVCSAGWISIRRLSLVAEHLSCKQKVKGSIPLIAFFINVCVESSVCVHSFCQCVCVEKKSVSVSVSVSCVWNRLSVKSQSSEALVVQWYDVSLPRMRPGFDSRQAHFS